MKRIKTRTKSGKRATPKAASLPSNTDEWRPLTQAQIEEVRKLPMDLGMVLGDVDEVLYGLKKKSRE